MLITIQLQQNRISLMKKRLSCLLICLYIYLLQRRNQKNDRLALAACLYLSCLTICLKGYLKGVLWDVTLSLSDPLLGCNGLLCRSCWPNPSTGINNTSAVIASARYTDTHLADKFTHQTQNTIQAILPTPRHPNESTGRIILMPKLKTWTFYDVWLRKITLLLPLVTISSKWSEPAIF